MKESDKPDHGNSAVYKPHDRFFREVFSQEDNARNLLLATLPDGISGLLDLRSIVVESTTMIDGVRSEHQTDLLIRTKLGRSPAIVYILVEHKSYADRWSVFQLLKYMVRIWERERLKREAGMGLPIIIPVLFYHGTRQWRMPLDFSSYFLPEETLNPYIPTFRPVMIDLQAMEDRDFRGNRVIQAVLKTLKHSRKNLRLYLVEILRSVMAVPMDEKHRAFLESIFGYILGVGTDIDERDVDRAFRFIGSREAREAYMTLAEQLMAKGKEQGKEEGKEEGKREGLLEGKQDSLLTQLAQKFGTVSEADEKKVRETKDPDKLDQALILILTSESVEETLKPLDS